MAKPETHQMRCNWRAKRHLGHTRGWRRNVGKYARDKRGDLPPEVTGGRSQSLRSTVRLKSGARRNGWETGVMLGRAPWSLNSCRGSLESAGSKTAEVPERAIQAESPPTQWGWVDRTVWTERMLAALGNGVKGNKWFSLIDKVYRPATLQAAWEQVKSNRGGAGIDGQSIEAFAADAERYLDELAKDLEEGKYQSCAVRRVEIPKAGGKTRPLGIPTVKDRIVQTAVKRVIEPIFEKEFLPMSYGFRPGKGCKDALREVDEWLKKGYTHVVDADLKGYFDSIPHPLLKERIEERISDGRLLELLAGWLRQDIVKGLERWTATGGPRK